MITATVAMPVYNSKDIVWLAMESLCRQKDINFKWEFIVCEEQGDGCAGKGFFEGYMDRLKDIGCSKLKYIPIESKIALGLKWNIIAQATSKTSVVFIPIGADDYTHPYKAARVYNALKDGKHTWYQCDYGYLYDITTGKVIKYDHTTLPKTAQARSSVYFGTLTRCMRSLPKSDRERGVDGWMFSVIGRDKMITDNNDAWEYGVFTNGMNNISLHRGRFFEDIKTPFVETTAKIGDIIPGDVAYRLLQMIPEKKEKEVEYKYYTEAISIDHLNSALVDYTIYLHRNGKLRASCFFELIQAHTAMLNLTGPTKKTGNYCDCNKPKCYYRDPGNMKFRFCKLCLRPIKNV